ncbi:MAG: glycosyltransferase [Acidobacteria bacterium]|nr:glycosyltransferase [Acidobacteriota bacterium]
METQPIELERVEVPSWELGQLAELVQRGAYRTNLIHQNADVLPLFARKYGQGLLKNRYNIAYCVLELPSLRADWAQNLRLVDEVWVPSSYVAAAFRAATPLPVRVIPHTVDGLEEMATLGRRELGLPEGVCLFACVLDVSSGFERKDPMTAVRAFQEAFGASKDAMLLLKCHNSKYNPARMETLRRLTAAPNIRVVDELWNDERIHSLHKVADCLVSPHRGEGFGLNIAETMYFGNAVIATNYSANTDYLDETNGYPVNYRLVEIEKAEGPYLPGSVWASADVHHMAQQMRRVFDDNAERKRRGAAAARTIRERFSAEAVGRLIAARLAEIDQPMVRHPEGPKRFLPRGAPEWRLRQLKAIPRISLITPVYNVEAEWLRRCVESVKAQWYPYWELCLCDDGSTRQETVDYLQELRGSDPRIKVIREEENRGIAAASARAVEFSTGEWLAFLDNDDELAPDALLEVARLLQSQPELDVIYSDEDKINAAGEYCDHFHKPDWSPEHLQCVMYMLHLMVVRKKLFFDVGGFRAEYSGAQDYDLALRLAARTNRIGHIPKVLYHWRMIEGSAAAKVDAKPEALNAGMRALENLVASERLPARVEAGLLPGTFRVRYRVVGRPKASLVIVASNQAADLPGRGRVVLVENFVRSIHAKTEYRNFEVVISHDGNLKASTVDALSSMGCRLVQYERPEGAFNFAHKANWSLRQAESELLVLLNDDMEVIRQDWLSSLLEYAQQPWIGAVGGRLLFGDGRVQHVGMVLGVNEGAAHIYHGFSREFVGYNGYTHMVRNYSAVTGACLATRKSLFEEMGGFDEDFRVDYNDTDYCLKLVDAGYRIVYTPYCELYHFEGRSLKRTKQDPEEVARFKQRWSRYLAADPYYNVNLSRVRLDFSLR